MLRAWYWNLFSINLYASSSNMIVNLMVSLFALWPIALFIQGVFEKLLPFFDAVYNKATKFFYDVYCIRGREDSRNGRKE